jgi:hypothetical protein
VWPLVNPTTCEFTTTTPELSKARAFLKRRRKYFCVQKALCYSWSLKILQRWRCWFTIVGKCRFNEPVGPKISFPAHKTWQIYHIFVHV